MYAGHSLHRASEQVRGQFSAIDKIILNIKIFILKGSIADNMYKYFLQ